MCVRFTSNLNFKCYLDIFLFFTVKFEKNVFQKKQSILKLRNFYFK